MDRTPYCRATVLIYLQGITAEDFYYSYVKKHRSCWELVGNLKSRSGRFSIVTGLVVFFSPNYSILLLLYVLSYVPERNVAPHPTCQSKVTKKKPLHRGFQWWIDFEHSVSIIVVSDIHLFSFWGVFFGFVTICRTTSYHRNTKT
jgi:hypothetical protein